MTDDDVSRLSSARRRTAGVAVLRQGAVTQQWAACRAAAAGDSRPAPGTVASANAAPLSELETRLAGIWQSLLPVASIAPDDDFFAIGGHSLLATRMIARIAARLGVELPLISVFEAPTIRGLAMRVAAAEQRKPVAPDVIPRLERRAEA